MIDCVAITGKRIIILTKLLPQALEQPYRNHLGIEKKQGYYQWNPYTG